MSLRDFYPWARTPDHTDDIRALAAAGIVRPEEQDANEATWALIQALRSDAVPLLAHLPPPDSWTHALAQGELARAWEAAIQQLPANAHGRQRRGRTLALPMRRPAWMNAQWLDAFEAAVESHAIAEQVVFHAPARGPVNWSWPVRVGVLPDAGDLGGFRSVLRHWWYGKLFLLAGAGYGARRFDVLLLHGDGRMKALRDTEVEATAIVCVDELSGTPREKLRCLDELRRLGRAAFAAETVAGSDRARWFLELITGLSHGRPLHAALRDAAGRAPRVIADRAVLQHLDLHGGTEQILRRVEQTAPEAGPRIKIIQRVSSDLNLDTETSARDLTAALRRDFRRLNFDQESGGATTLGSAFSALERFDRLAAHASAAEESRAGRPSPLESAGTAVKATRLRQLRARLADTYGASKTARLMPRTDYSVEVSVGPPTREWLTDRAPFAEPDGPPDTLDGWNLRVVVREPNWIPEPVEAKIVLPPTGASTVARFSFRTGDEAGPFGARVMVLQGSRVLQTGVLTLDEAGARFRIDSAPQRVLADIDTDKWASASIVLNKDTTGTPTATTVHGRHLGVANLTDPIFEDFTAKVSSALRQIATQPQAFERLESEGTRKLLVELATSGGGFLLQLVKGAGLDAAKLDAASRIQIVSTRSSTFFPAEFVYGFPRPRDDAALCPGAAQALRDDAPCAAVHGRETVCPTGFWSLSKVIERYAHVPEHLNAAGPFTLYDGDGEAGVHLNPFRHILYAAASVADATDPTATLNVESAARGVAAGIARVTDWKAWEEAVARDKPSLLLLLPHHHGADLLRIGASSDLRMVEEYQVRAPDAPDAPLVLLLGCETLLTHAAFNNFVQNFLWSGAKAVVATYGTILGRHASPATVRLLEEMSNGLKSGSVRLGTVLRDLKRELLLAGQPMVLGLTSHGDADLLLER